MRVHITLDEGLVRELDQRVGARRRRSFIAQAVREALEDEVRWELVESRAGTVSDTGHDWDADAASWVREQRQAGHSRVG
jgi:metal-responsive CopG/Arc/MetJ family transcriptional regulator